MKNKPLTFDQHFILAVPAV